MSSTITMWMEQMTGCVMGECEANDNDVDIIITLYNVITSLNFTC